MKATQETFDTWGLVEIMGHRRLAGKLTEQTIAGAVFLRVDVPEGEGATRTQFYSSQAIYAIHPTDEATARAFAATHYTEPIQRYELLPPVAVREPAALGYEDPYGSDDDADDNDVGL